MMKQMYKRIGAWLLAGSMLFGMLSPAVVHAEPMDELTFNAASTYAIVSVDTGKAVSVKEATWIRPAIVVDGEVGEENQVSQNLVMKIKPATSSTNPEEETENVLEIFWAGVDGEEYPYRAEGNGFIFADPQKRTEECNRYVVEPEGDSPGQAVIKDAKFGQYFAVGEGGELLHVAGREKASVFRFIENPQVVDFTVYIEHAATGKYVRSPGKADFLSVDGTAGEDGVIGDDLRWSWAWGDYNGSSVTFISKAAPNLSWKGGNVDAVKLIESGSWGGWESIRVVPNGDGTVAFKDTNDGKYFTVSENKIAKTDDSGQCNENGKFIIHSITPPEAAAEVQVSEVKDTEAAVSWTLPNEQTFYTGYEVKAVPDGLEETAAVEKTVRVETVDTQVRLTGLLPGTGYTVSVTTKNGTSEATPCEKTFTTLAGPAPSQAAGLQAEKTEGGIRVTWEPVETAVSYDVYRAVSAYAEYEKIEESVTDCAYTDADGEKDSYYRVTAKNANGSSEQSAERASLEKSLFGEKVIIFSPTDKREEIDRVVQAVFMEQNDAAKDAQFNTNRYAIYYKPGDYTDAQCVPVGFYTHIGGLGRTPYEVKLNNMEVPAYLDGTGTEGNYWEDGGTWRNATCNFWRSAENLSVVGTGDATTIAVTAPQSQQNWYPADFNWSVAQAAPLRRVYSTRNVRYDWSYGWASGGYTADCLFEANAGTASGQQYFTRNSVIKGDASGTTLNNFFMGVTSGSLPNADTGKALVRDNGYSNWAMGPEGEYQKVATSISETPAVREKPFLFLDTDGAYKIFVPSMRRDSAGVSWSQDQMGEGEILPLDEFYIAHEGDSASVINAQLAAGKNIFFTPGVYYAEEVIRVEHPDTILLGTGMASIIPTNAEAAMEVADVDGVTVSGLIFDAGAGSEYLLKVGEAGRHTDHAANPTLLQDLFFRVGGTTSELTKAENALEINSDDVITDHFWIWRADHGAGVRWNGNESKHGLIVNGDDVTCYALFNEHFQEYDTLWNGENGATYFYQNEKCYDPISQEAWMTHKDTVNGYAAYKVANHVDSHYAVGLGIYNVFIYTGEDYDASKVQIELENAIEVPNKEQVLVENACIQTFANEDGAMQKFNHIINGVGNGVSSGIDAATGEKGDGWSRQFLISYQNGTAVYGKKEDGQKGMFVGLVTQTDVRQPMNEAGDVDLKALQALCGEAGSLLEAGYTAESWKPFAEALAEAREQLEKGEDWAVQADVDAAERRLSEAMDALVKKPSTNVPGGDDTPGGSTGGNTTGGSGTSGGSGDTGSGDTGSTGGNTGSGSTGGTTGGGNGSGGSTDGNTTGSSSSHHNSGSGSHKDSTDTSGTVSQVVTVAEPKTGDSTHTAAYVFAAALAAAGIAAALWIIRKKRR